MIILLGLESKHIRKKERHRSEEFFCSKWFLCCCLCVCVCFVDGKHFVIFYFHLRPKYWKNNHANSTHVLPTYHQPKDMGVLLNNNGNPFYKKCWRLFGHVWSYVGLGFWRVIEYLANQSVRNFFPFSLRKLFSFTFPGLLIHFSSILMKNWHI